MLTHHPHGIFAAIVLLMAIAASGCSESDATSTAPGVGGTSNAIELLNVSYDPTRELWKDLNAAFVRHYTKNSGVNVSIKQSHGGSGSQARAVIDGLEADVVTLALWSDTNAIARKGLIREGWDERLPNHSLPYVSTIVFVVRRGNPKKIKDWPDLVQKGLEIVTPNPKVSGNGKLSFLAAWGSVITNGGSEEDARKYVTALYRNVPILDQGARQATTTFAQKGLGDVHLTWENEAHLEVREAGGELEIVYPPRSILAEPTVSVVDANVDHKGTRAAAESYLQFLYTPEGQEIIAKHHYRPTNPSILQKDVARFPLIELFPISRIANNWDEAQRRFFAEGGIFDSIYTKGP